MSVYTKTNWLARIAVKANRFAKTNETTEYVELTSEPESITQNGTEFTADRMNNLETGVYGAVGQISAGSAHTIGEEYLVSCTAAITVSIPDGYEIGTRKRIRNTAGSNVTLSFSGSDEFEGGVTSLLIIPNGFVEIEKISSSEWVVAQASEGQRSFSTTQIITAGEYPEESILVDASAGNVTITIADGKAGNVRHIQRSAGTGIVYLKDVSGNLYNASGTGIPVTLKCTIRHNGTKWVADNEVTADYDSGVFTVRQSSQGAMTIFEGTQNVSPNVWLTFTFPTSFANTLFAPVATLYGGDYAAVALRSPTVSTVDVRHQTVAAQVISLIVEGIY